MYTYQFSFRFKIKKKQFIENPKITNASPIHRMNTETNINSYGTTPKTSWLTNIPTALQRRSPETEQPAPK